MSFAIQSEQSVVLTELSVREKGFALATNTTGFVSDYVSCIGWSSLQIHIRTQVLADITIDFMDFDGVYVDDPTFVGVLPALVGAGLPSYTKRISANGLQYLSIPIMGCRVRIRVKAPVADADKNKNFSMTAVLSNNTHYVLT